MRAFKSLDKIYKLYVVGDVKLEEIREWLKFESH